MFVGRIEELDLLKELRQKKISSLVCVLGRRRIGKSRLIAEFGSTFESYISIQGLGPDSKPTNKDQLKHFSEKLAQHFKTGVESFNDWDQAFHSLAVKTSKGSHLILLDEISWMGGKDEHFSAKLKDAWDSHFKKNPKLILVLCGSVSSWIEDNLLNNTSFAGRVSLALNLGELSLKEINQFWDKSNYHFGQLEKILILSVCGGVPKYLEEILKNKSAEQNIIKLCFTKNGLLYNEFASIFTEIFGKRSNTFEKIIQLCLIQKLSPNEVAKKLKKTLNSELSRDLHILEISGFLARDYSFRPDGQASKISHLRVKDNYLRFFLKIIAPMKMRIEKGGVKVETLYQIPGFDSILGLQFENLILGNRQLIYPELNLKTGQIIAAAPHIQRKTTTNKGACQIDLLIQTDFDVYFVCEFKCQKIIDRTIVSKMQKKLKILSVPKRSGVKPVLVYAGEIHPPHLEEISNYFYKIISFQDLIKFGQSK
jgi:AAA+ ATPase superfamily predicted ATPase